MILVMGANTLGYDRAPGIGIGDLMQTLLQAAQDAIIFLALDIPRQPPPTLR
jgi:hypothetical protein